VEIIIVIVIIAVLVAGAIPYMYDSIANSTGDRAADAIALKAQEVRSKAIESGEDKKISITTGGITDVTLPSGWHLEVKGLNDSKFHPPFRNQTWNFSSVGICEPLEFRLSDNDRQINIAFDALTAQLLQDHE
jgi:Tfp pilus assembly protein FimT